MRKKILAGLLALVMLLSLLPVMQFSVSANVAEDADVIRLPITVRDVNQDYVLFQGQYATTTGFDHEADTNRVNNYYVGHQLVNGVPQYNDVAIRNVAALIQGRNTNNGYLNNALTAARNAHTGTWNNTAPSQYDVDVTYLEDAPTAYSAAKWILSHLFVDGQYYDGDTAAFEAGEANTAAAEFYYTKTYPGYESLVLKPDGTYNGQDCYFYTSNYSLSDNTKTLQDTMFNYTNGAPTGNDEIYNVTNGTDSKSGGWFPLDGRGFGQTNNGEGGNSEKHNYHTTTAGSGQFVYHADDKLFFAFTGDDDFFFYINDQLVIDDGGVHGQQESWVYLEDKVLATAGTIGGNNLIRTQEMDADKLAKIDANTTWAEYLGLEEGGIYNFNFFQMERNATGSNFSIYTNIKVVDSSAVPAKKAYQNGQELIYGSFVPQNSEVTYGFEMTNNGNTKVNSNASAITNLTFVDDLLGVNLNKDNPIIYTDNVSENTYADLEYAIYETEKGAPAAYTKLTNATGEATLKDLLAAGVEPGYTFSIRGFKYNVGAPGENQTTKTIVNTVTTTAQGKANNSGTTKTLHGTASMRIRTWDIQNKTFVMDYAKTMNLTNDEVFGNELAELSGEGIEVTEKISDSESVTTEASLSSTVDVSLNRNNGDYGTMSMTKTEITSDGETYDGYNLTYTPNKILNGIDSFILKITLDTTTTITKTNGNNTSTSTSEGSNTLNKNVTIVPANNVYYEDTFVGTTPATDESDPSVQIVYNGKVTTGSSSGNEGEYVGEDVDNDSTTTNNTVHGWVTSLADDTQFSDGSATKMTSGAKASFTFTGTGVDIYSYTDMSTGVVTAVLTQLDAEEKAVSTKYTMIDNLAVSGSYYQIPTLSFQGLTYGTYKVSLVVGTAAAPEVNSEGKVVVDGNGDIVYSDTNTRTTYYLDGIRVYNPLGNDTTKSEQAVSDKTVQEAYGETELNAMFTEVRDILKTTDDDSSAVFTDLDGEGKTTAAKYDASEYGIYGPKNEVYLKEGQAITFKVADMSHTYQIGLKAPEGTAATANWSNGTTDTVHSSSIGHTTDLYYSVIPVANDDGTGTITVTNVSGGLLSVTKIKTTNAAAAATLMLAEMTEDEAVAEVAAFSLRSAVAYSAPAEEETPEEPVEPEIPEEPTEPETPEEPTEPEIPDIDIEIENPEPKPEQKPTQKPNQNEVLKTLVTNLFNKIFGWFGR